MDFATGGGECYGGVLRGYFFEEEGNYHFGGGLIKVSSIFC